MASAEEKILLSRLLDLFRADPDKITSFLQAGTSRENIANNSPSPSSTASCPSSPDETDSPGSRSSDTEVDRPAGNSITFTADELLKPRSRKMKATAAQQTFAVSDELKLFARAQRKESICKPFRIFVFQFILREAAKKCEIWESAPHIKDIPAKNIAKFEKKVRGQDLVVYIKLQLKFPALFEGLSCYSL